MSKKLMIGVASLVAVLVLAGAAFMALRMISAKSAAVQKGAMLAVPGGPGVGGSMRSFALNVNPSPDLPQREPDGQGKLEEKSDNSLLISPAAGPFSEDEQGPSVEVVITRDTKIYRDATLENRDQPPKENEEIQQKVELSSLDEIQSEDMVMVWGEKRGDRIIAEVIFYMRPVIIRSTS